MKWLLVVISLYAFLMLMQTGGELRRARASLSASRETELALRRENAALRSAIDGEPEQERLERLAREKLGLCYPGETVIMIQGD